MKTKITLNSEHNEAQASTVIPLQNICPSHIAIQSKFVKGSLQNFGAIILFAQQCNTNNIKETILHKLALASLLD